MLNPTRHLVCISNLLVTATSILVAATGCTQQSSQVDSGPKTQAVVALEGTPASIDPVAVMDVHSQMVASSVHSPLAWVEPSGKLRLVVAEQMVGSSDGLKIDIKIRPAISFWDGSPVRSGDVRFSIERFRRSAHPHRWICDRMVGVDEFDKKATNHIAGIVVQDDKTLSIQFAQPEPDAAWLVSSLATAIVKEGSDTLPEKPFGSQVVGCGPFSPETLKPGDAFEVVRNPGFLGSNRLGRLKFTVMNDAQSRLQAAQQDRVDVVRLRGPMLSEACEASSDGTLRLKTSFARKQIVSVSGNELTFLLINYQSEKFSKMTAEQKEQWHAMLSSVMARDVLVKNLYLSQGGAEVAEKIAPPSTLTGGTTIANPAGAVRVEGPVKLTFLSANDATSRQLAAFVQARCREVGLELEVQLVELPNLVQRLLGKQYEVGSLWVEQQIVSSGPIPWISFFDPKAPLSVVGEGLPDVAPALTEARGIMNAQARSEAYSRIVDTISTRQTAWVPLVSRRSVFVIDKRLSIFLDRNGTPVTGLITAE